LTKSSPKRELQTPPCGCLGGTKVS